MIIMIQMENGLLEQLAREIAQSENRWYIMEEIKWLLDGHYTKCRFLAMLMSNNLFKKEYYKLSEELTDRNLLLKLYNLIQETVSNKS